ncbi:aldehyde dehydrogenase [Flammeovirga yaeyamensis]|uniref:Aldehyde dehydrogenase n=1 Tax=Flammeovirga yaeyamensis TaxID=367791 RepID=A0AAX1N6F2_9BACT|nr:aldehyde dehydrogenase [Flammeovirga yaeyamensis]MBB3697378.1 lactaldehyde dehydrogenase/glycolaldehyde dehydrogenase [Flammeovirga yaeyamensis]NMF36072.1 aldehyde dehydrogenase [Flammeovirga yaeyamensis]QWG02807.1 aldehyde dehydrogenase [Flammeovirga yaeyamensis]
MNTTTTQDIKVYPCYINGEWVETKKGEYIDVENPANNQVFARVYCSTETEVQLALESADKAQFAWQMLPANDRANYLYAISEKLNEERDHFARLLVMEQGKTLAEAYGEVDDTIRYINYSAEAGRRIEGSIFPSDMSNEQLSIHKVPYGVTVGLMAFNYPLALIGRKIGPALITGNTMVIKPSELTPITASEFCRLVHEAGLPKGVISMVMGWGHTVGTQLIESPITKLVSMTGSTRAGQAIYKTASQNVAGLVLELGGKAPFIVMEDAEIDKAVEAAVVSRYANCGQVCICNEMLFVHEKIADEFTEKVIERTKQITVGDPMTQVNMGPNVSTKGLSRVHDLVMENISQGAELVLGGKRPEGRYFEEGNWYDPTILTNVKSDDATLRNELFGPVLPIMKVSGYEEAKSLLNDREEGLSAYLFTQNHKTIMKSINEFQVGTIFINKGIVGYIQGFHSGHKTSGIGGEDGIYGIEQYLQKRAIYLNYE